MLREIGLLETRYFHYYEEVDLSLRARAAGWTTGYACTSRIWHAVGASLSTRSPQALYYHVRNRQLVRRKLWYDRPGETLLREPEFTRWLAENVLRSFLRGRWTLTRALLTGLVDGLRGRGGMRNVAPGR
jgi:GT2 family glycosyltransferase